MLLKWSVRPQVRAFSFNNFSKRLIEGRCKAPKCTAGPARPVRESVVIFRLDATARTPAFQQFRACHSYLPSRPISVNAERTIPPCYRGLPGDEETSVEWSFVPLFCFSVCPMMLVAFMSALAAVRHSVAPRCMISHCAPHGS